MSRTKTNVKRLAAILLAAIIACILIAPCAFANSFTSGTLDNAAPKTESTLSTQVEKKVVHATAKANSTDKSKLMKMAKTYTNESNDLLNKTESTPPDDFCAVD